MILYDTPNPAPNPRRVRIFLAEKGLTVPMETVNLMAREHKSPEHRDRNSLGQVPTLVLDDGTAISETVAICRYFEETTPNPPMFGTTPAEKALADMWVRRVEFVLMMPAGNYWRHAHPRTAALLTQFKDFGESNQEAYDKALKWLDRELEGREFIGLDVFNVADICALTTVDFAKWIGLPGPETYPNLAKWHARVSARPSAKA